MTKKIKNKSSIVRIIISNFDYEKIKELKILYKKHAGVDTIGIQMEKINFDTADETNKIFFVEGTPKGRKDTLKRENIGLECETDKEHNIIVKKYYEGEMIKNYKISGIYEKTKSNEILVTVELEDLLNKNDSDKRTIKTKTTRKLLKEEVCKNYALIEKTDFSKIDSNKIYNINRFLDYRSNMLYYYIFINYFIMKSVKKEDLSLKEGNEKEIWKIFQVKDINIIKNIKEDIKKQLKENISQFIENYEERIEKLKEKDNHQHQELVEISKEKLIEHLDLDIDKILELLVDLRHKLMHYDYSYFNDLFTGKLNSQESQKLKYLLDLNIFKELSKIKEAQLKEKLNYITDKDEIEIFQGKKTEKAKTIYNLYNRICNAKRGFNNYVNSFFYNDGEEIIEVKELINNDFENRDLDKFKNRSNKDKELLNGEAYYSDIHLFKDYKKLYNRKKELVTEQSSLIDYKNKDQKKRLKDLNNLQTKKKQEMEKITNFNSLNRLEYKMKIAFGILNEEKILHTLKGNYLNRTELFKQEKINKVAEYLKISIDDSSNKSYIEDLTKALDNNKEESILKDKVENNLIKFYTLIYLLLPREIKGDFLGFIKHNYYQMKNNNFESEELKNENEEDNFFHNLRRFEAINKKIEIFSYDFSFLNGGDIEIQNLYTKLGIEGKFFKRNGVEKDFFKHNIFVTLIKYYENIFKLCNDVELSCLLAYCSENNKKLEIDELEKDIKPGKYLNFSNVIKYSLKKFNLIDKLQMEKSLSNIKSKLDLRNKIDHLNFKELFIDVLNNEGQLKEEEDKLIQVFKELSGVINFRALDKNIMNDFYMRKEQLHFNLRKYLAENGMKEKTSKDYLSKQSKEKELLAFYKLTKDNYPEIIKTINFVNAYIEKGELDLKIKKGFKDKYGMKEINLIKKKNRKTEKYPKNIENIEKDNNELEKAQLIRKLNEDVSLLIGLYKREKTIKIKKYITDKILKRDDVKALTFRIHNSLNVDLVKKLYFEIVNNKLNVYMDDRYLNYDSENSSIELFDNIIIEFKYENDNKKSEEFFEIKGYLKNNSSKVYYHNTFDYKNNKIILHQTEHNAKEIEYKKKIKIGGKDIDVRTKNLKHDWDFKFWEVKHS
ncbi:MAG: type VI-C CRISPR-associated RNA-guided ribonuclease Cas13c [Fusobacterium sp. JB019]|nr:type VI-C CRISPR-associated RNA-guided ribonuclease Cas13c [Fusobacterium sp. JB019]